MQTKIEIVEEAERICLCMTGFDQSSSEILFERLNELLPVLREIVCFDECISGLSDDDFESRHLAINALGMKYQGLLAAAMEQANCAHSVASGEEKAGTFGFPEFDDV